MTPTPANDNTPQQHAQPQRPAWFDAKLFACERFIRGQCRKYSAQIEPEDLYQETLARALAKWRRYREGGSFTAWLAFLVREIVGQDKKKHKHIFVTLQNGDHPTIVASQDFHAELADMHTILPAGEYTATTMRGLGHSGAEIAERLGTTPTRAENVVTRGRRRLCAAAVAANDNNKVTRCA